MDIPQFYFLMYLYFSLEQIISDNLHRVFMCCRESYRVHKRVAPTRCGVKEDFLEKVTSSLMKNLDINMLPLKCLWAIQVELPAENLLRDNDI